MKYHPSLLFTSVTVPEEVTVIGKRAFADNRHLKRIYLPPHITAIETEAFRNCLHLKTLAPAEMKHHKGAFLPEYVTSIGDSAFQGCCALHSIVLPSSVQTIGNEAFRSCHSLTSLTIPETVQHMGSYLMRDCWNVKRNFDGCTVNLIYPEIVLHIRRSEGETFHFPLPRMYERAPSIDDSVLCLLLQKEFATALPQSQRRQLICRMLESGYLTEEYLVSHAEVFFSVAVIDDNTEALHFLMDSGKFFQRIPAALYEKMILLANQMQNYDMQLLLMNTMNQYVHDDMMERFQL